MKIKKEKKMRKKGENIVKNYVLKFSLYEQHLHFSLHDPHISLC